MTSCLRGWSSVGDQSDEAGAGEGVEEDVEAASAVRMPSGEFGVEFAGGAGSA